MTRPRTTSEETLQAAKHVPTAIIHSVFWAVLFAWLFSCAFVLAIPNMDEAAALQSLDRYAGPIMATHSNCAALMKGADSNRHISDQVLRGLIERGGVNGVLPLNSFLKPGWTR